jgi:CDP-paratose 2-epimerase
MGVEDQGWAAWFLLAGVFGLPTTIYGDGKQVRDLLFVDDLIDAYLAAVDAISVIAGRAYNIGGGPDFRVSVWREFSVLLAELDLPMPSVDFAPARPGDQRVYVSDVRRARDDFGWAPRTPPSEGLARLGEWVVGSKPALRSLHPA